MSSFIPINPDRLVTEGVPGPTKVPMKALILALLRPEPGSTVIEVGAGSGSLTLELAKAVGPWGEVVAVEGEPEAVRSLRRNVGSFCLEDRVRIVEGWAPEALEGLEGADHAVVTGARDVDGTVEFLTGEMRVRRLLVAAVTPETFARAREAVPEGYDVEAYCFVWGEGKVLGGTTLFSGMRDQKFLLAVRGRVR